MEKIKVMNNYKLIAMDMDGTLTQHKSPLEQDCRNVLEKLAEKYQLLMVCAGSCERVHNQLKGFPISISGFYGMQYSEVNNGKFEILESSSAPVNRDEVLKYGETIRNEFGFFDYIGEPVEFHASGLITFPILGTATALEDKLKYDPDRAKRRVCYERVCEIFDGYNVFIGGTSSFDIAPKPYNKLYALNCYLEKYGLTHNDVIFFGDDYGIGGNDRQVYESEIKFVCIDNYKDFPRIAQEILL